MVTYKEFEKLNESQISKDDFKKIGSIKWNSEIYMKYLQKLDKKYKDIENGMKKEDKLLFTCYLMDAFIRVNLVAGNKYSDEQKLKTAFNCLGISTEEE